MFWWLQPTDNMVEDRKSIMGIRKVMSKLEACLVNVPIDRTSRGWYAWHGLSKVGKVQVSYLTIRVRSGGMSTRTVSVWGPRKP